MQRTTAIRIAIAQLLLSIFFVSFILVIDPLVGDTVVRWMALGYILVSGVVTAFWLPGYLKALRSDPNSLQ